MCSMALHQSGLQALAESAAPPLPPLGAPPGVGVKTAAWVRTEHDAARALHAGLTGGLLYRGPAKDP